MHPPLDMNLFKPWDPLWVESWLQDTLILYNTRLEAIQPLKVEASHRRFYRLQLSPPATHLTQQCSAVFMLSPPSLEQNVAFETLAGVFAEANTPVPEILAADHDQGAFLMTDLGHRSLEDCYYQTESPDLKHQAVRSAITELHNISRIQNPDIPAYTRDRLTMELGIFSEWVLEKLLHQTSAEQNFLARTQVLLDAIGSQPKGCVHRDYHCRNLIYDQRPARPTRAATDTSASTKGANMDAKLGIVDFQDALSGPGLYDIASLLRDCYYTFGEDDIDIWLDIFLEQSDSFHTLQRSVVKRQFDFTALQRQLKAMGIFLRLALRGDKTTHLQYVAPLLQRVITLSSNYAELSELTDLLSHGQVEIVTGVDHLMSQSSGG